MTGTSLLNTQENLVGTTAFDFMMRSCKAHCIRNQIACPGLNLTAVAMQDPSTHAVNKGRVTPAYIIT